MFAKLVAALKATPPAPPIEDPRQVDELYRHWRLRVMYSLFIGYALFYLCRKNLAIAMPAMGAELGLSNTQLGLFATLLYVTYGVGKLVNGVLADRANPRWFMAAGLFLSAAMNAAFGLSAGLTSLAVAWAFNGWFQSMGFPPCARLLANWYGASERGTTWSLWHVSHQLGAFVVAALSGYVIHLWGWRSVFLLPAVICALGALFLAQRLRDTPPSMGLPSIAVYRDDPEVGADGRLVDDSPETFSQILIGRVLTNKYIWLISLMNLFVYVVRFGTFDWATKYLVEVKGSDIVRAGVVVSMVELAGIAGPILAGVLTDRYTNGRRGPVCAVAFALATVGLVMFYLVPPGHPWVDGAALALIGFMIYGPQFLVGVFVTDFASRKAAATAIGLTGVFGYAGAALSGVGTGALIDRFGWAGGFGLWIGAGVVGTLLALSLWNARPGRV